MMKIAICTRNKHIELTQSPVPAIDREKVLLEIKTCGVCGSDIAAWLGSGHKKYPYTPGHEFCGIVRQKGQNVKGLSVGQSVLVDPNLGCGNCRFCRMKKPNLCQYLKSRPIKSNGAFAQYVALDYRMVHPQPEELDDKLAAFVEPVSCAIHAMKTAQAGPSHRIVVFGAGLMGFFTAMAFKDAGREVTVVDLEASRRERVEKLLGLPALSPVDLEDNDRWESFDTGIDCSGNAKAVAQAVKVLCKTGRLVLAGLVLEPAAGDISLIDVTTKELCLQGVWLNPFSFAQAIELVQRQKTTINALRCTHYPLDKIAQAFEQAASSHTDKVLVHCRDKDNLSE